MLWNTRYLAFGMMIATLLSGCNMTNVKPGADVDADAPNAAEDSRNSGNQPQKQVGNLPSEASSAGVSVSDAGGHIGDALRAINNQNDRLSGRLVLMQGQLLELKKQLEQMQSQNQMMLTRLQLMTGSNLRHPATTDSNNASDVGGQMDAAIAQLMDMLNSINAGSGSGGAFSMATTYTAKGDWILLKYRRDTGESWLADQSGWRPLNDSMTLPASDYRITVERADKDLKGYVAVRVDEQTGKSWWLKDKQWNLYP